MAIQTTRIDTVRNRYGGPLIHFTWKRPPEAVVGPAYALAWSKRRSKRPINAIRVPAACRWSKPVRPLEWEKPRLFEAVADLDVDDSSAVETFAREWGLLYGENLWLRLESTPKPGTRGQWVGQNLEAWRFGVAVLREARELWRAISQADEDAISRLVTVRGGIAVYNGESGIQQLPLPRRSMCDAGRVALAWIITEQSNSPLGVGYDRNAPRRLRRVARPKDLLAAAWAQLAQHVTSDAALACPRCGGIFVVPLTAGGRRAKYCSQACKQAITRRRAKDESRRT